MDRFDDLGAVLDHVWTFIEDGPSDFQHPFATPTFVTSGPDARTITLREADAERRTLAFHSDARAAKIDELRRDPSAAFHVWDPERRQQFVLHGEAAVHTMGEIAERVWQEEPPPALAIYCKPDASGSQVEAPQSGLTLPEGKEKGDLTREDVDSGYEHFAVVRTVIDRIDWLHTHPDGHYRARFAWNGKAFDSTWVLP